MIVNIVNSSVSVHGPEGRTYAPDPDSATDLLIIFK